MKTIAFRSVILAAALGTGAVAAACGGGGGGGDGVTPLLKVEVRDYRGQNLSSIADFRENSIAGPQRVDAAAWRLTVTGLVDRPLSLDYAAVTTGFKAY